MNNKVTIICFIFILISVYACERTFHGKVVDADTKEPIEGAVVVAHWSESTATIEGGHQRFKDVKEKLTDINGEWEVSGAKGDRFIARLFALIPGIYYTEEPEFIIFKPGYCSYRQGFSIEACKEKMGPYAVGEGQVTKLPKLTRKADRKRLLPGTAGFSRDFDKKQLYFLKLINEERKALFGQGDLDDYIKELESEK